MPDKLGIGTLSDVIVEAFNIVHDVRDSLPKIGLEDLGRFWSIIKNGKGLAMTNWNDVLAEARDLNEAENKMLGELVDAKLVEQDIVVEDIDLLVAAILDVLEGILAVVELLPKKSVAIENDSTKG